MSISLLVLFTLSMFAVMSNPTQKTSAAGGRYKVNLHYTPSHYGSMEKDVAELLKSQLEDTGYFDVTLKSAEWSTYLDQLGFMEMFLLGWWFDYPDASNYIDPFVGGGAFSMGTNYSSTTMDGYIDTLLEDPDLADRQTATVNAQKLMAVDVPCIPLFTMLSQFSAYQTDVTGVVQEPSENMHYGTIKDGDTEIVIGTTDSLRNLDPSDCYEYYGSNTLVQLTHGLMEMPVTSTDAVKGPITSWYNVSADATLYYFNLKQGVKFSDGTDLNATAVQYNWNRSIGDSDLGGDPAFLLGDVVNKTEVLNDTLFKVTLNGPDATFLQRLTYTVAWPVSMATIDYDTIGGKPGDTWVAGCGPYKITTWTADTEMILEPNTHYNASLLGTTAPLNDKIIIKFYTDASTLQLGLESGDIDVAHKDFGPDERTSLKSKSGITTTTKATAGIRYILINVQSITDKNVRQAISCAVDRSDITSTIFEDYNDPLLSMVPEIFTSHHAAYVDGPVNACIAGNMTSAGYASVPLPEGGDDEIPGFETFTALITMCALSVLFVKLQRKKRN